MKINTEPARAPLGGEAFPSAMPGPTVEQFPVGQLTLSTSETVCPSTVAATVAALSHHCARFGQV
ncbi:MAG TPA: hypothetical protein PKD31_11050, partial [Blastocatellia bacterium]|nr:hypothetical protein [Blastocatellia bacterium]